MQIRINRGSEVAIYQQIIQSIRSQILQGTLPVGFRLPPERTLARTLGVNRTTIMNAYAELKAEGLIHGRVGDGTRVAAGDREAPDRPRDVLPLRWSDFTRLSFRPSDDAIKRLLALSEAQDVIVLSLGFPALDLIPLGDLEEAADAVMKKRGAPAFFYGPAEGVSTFRQTLSAQMEERGIVVGPDRILVTSGAQQALDLVARAFLEPGDTVVVEEPTYLGALQVFRAARARIVSIPVDEDGMRTDLLESVLERSSPKLIYTLPTFQNPSGAVMSLERRMKLLDLAYRFRVPILEDDTYGDIWFDEPPPPPLATLDRREYVLYASSFSKTLCPGLRVGWLAGPRMLIRHLVQVKQTIDLQASTLSQMIVGEMIESGKYAKHTIEVRAAYGARCEAMGASLRKRAKGWAEWSRPRGGYYYWCRIKTPLSVAALAAGAAERRVSILPGAACMADEPLESFVRLSFSYARPDEIDAGIARLARVIRRAGEAARPAGASVVATRPVI